MGNEIKNLKKDLDAAIKKCNENLPKCMGTDKTTDSANVRASLLDVLKCLNKLYKAKAGVGKIHTKINFEKLFDIKNFTYYTANLLECIGGKNYLDNDSLSELNGCLINLQKLQSACAGLIADVEILLDCKKIIAPVASWLTDQMQNLSTSMPTVDLSKLGYIVGFGSHSPLSANPPAPLADFEEYDLTREKNAEYCRTLEISGINRYCCCDLARYRNNWARRDVEALARTANAILNLDEGAANGFVRALTLCVENGKKRISDMYENLVAVQKEQSKRDSSKMLILIKTAKTNLTSYNVAIVLTLWLHKTMDPRRRKEINKLLTNVNMVNKKGLLPAK